MELQSQSAQRTASERQQWQLEKQQLEEEAKQLVANFARLKEKTADSVASAERSGDATQYAPQLLDAFSGSICLIVHMDSVVTCTVQQMFRAQSQK